jgi:minor extracellular serine protease Vpr
MQRALTVLFLLVGPLAILSFGQSSRRAGEYALILDDPPVARQVASRAELQSAAAQTHLTKIRTAQRSVLAELQRRKVRVNGTSQVLVNGIFVDAPRESGAELRKIPGVKYVQWLPLVKRHLYKALDLQNVAGAWSAVGGASNAGAGIKIGIIDTGIDKDHPGFKDTGFTMPPGFPIGDSRYTNNKVIVARSYVSMLVGDDPETDRPDDLTPRDRVGHGTAIAMIAAGVQNAGPAGTIQGVAPKAFLGNYKVFGSPGVNDYSLFSAIEQALKDALYDEMDIVTLSLDEGNSAFYGALDIGSCSNTNPNEICDIRAMSVENAVAMGLVVVVSAGNDGASADNYPLLQSIHTPGSAPSAITVGASTNSHILYQAVRVNAANAPSNLRNIAALFDDGPQINAPKTATLIDVRQIGDDGLACSALPAASLAGAIALIQRGTCAFSDKINYAQSAGAVGVIVYQVSGTDFIYNRLFAQNTGIPAVMIGNADGKALKDYIDSNSGATVSLDPAFTAVDAPFNTIWAPSSRGPNVGNFAVKQDFAVKPELVAVGTDLYTATQKLDPNGESYHASGYTTVTGTSYAVPMVAGAVAIAKQNNSRLNTPGRLKSAVVNTATQDVVDNRVQASVTAMGAGKLNVGNAVSVAATLEPATLAFGAIGAGTLPVSRTVTVTNVSNSAVTLNFAVKQFTVDSRASVTVTPSSLTLQAGQPPNSVTVRLQGAQPAPGSYEGFLEVTGAGPTLHLPYLYLVGDGVPYNIVSWNNGSFIGGPSDKFWYLDLKVTDRYGAPVAQRPVQYTLAPGAQISVDPDTGQRLFDSVTDRFGVAQIDVDVGPQTGYQIFSAAVGNLTTSFFGYVRPYPDISANGVVDAASFQVGQGLAPGSYASIFGDQLSDALQAESTTSLPVSLSAVSVGFEDGGLRVPGRLHFVSARQVNVQIPWEFQGHSSVNIKLNVGLQSSFLYTLPLAKYSPGVLPALPGQAAITDANGNLIGASNPAVRGQTIIVYANGLGAIDHTPASGEATPLTQPYAQTSVTPSVKIGGSTARVDFSGLTPGSIGLYQINAVVPADAPTGTQQLVVSIGGVDAKPVSLTVQ